MKIEAIGCDHCGKVGISVDDTRVTTHKCAGSWTVLASAEVADTERMQVRTLIRAISATVQAWNRHCGGQPASHARMLAAFHEAQGHLIGELMRHGSGVIEEETRAVAPEEQADHRKIQAAWERAEHFSAAIGELLAVCHLITHDRPGDQPNNDAERALFELVAAWEKCPIEMLPREHPLKESLRIFSLRMMAYLAAEATICGVLKRAEDKVRELTEQT